MSTSATSARFLHVPGTLLSTVRTHLVGDREPLDAVNALRGIGYELGEEVRDALGERMARDFAGRAWEDLDPADFWRAASGFFEDRGWGTLAFHDLHPAVGMLELSGWIEAGSGGGPRGCHLSVGLFSALLERLSGSAVGVLELPGEPGGATRLLFARPDVLGIVYEAVRGGATPAEAVGRLG